MGGSILTKVVSGESILLEEEEKMLCPSVKEVWWFFLCEIMWRIKTTLLDDKDAVSKRIQHSLRHFEILLYFNKRAISQNIELKCLDKAVYAGVDCNVNTKRFRTGVGACAKSL